MAQPNGLVEPLENLLIERSRAGDLLIGAGDPLTDLNSGQSLIVETWGVRSEGSVFPAAARPE